MVGAELYNLKADIGEKNNLAATSPEKVKQLAAAWDAWNVDNIDPTWTSSRRGGREKGANKKKKNAEKP